MCLPQSRRHDQVWYVFGGPEELRPEEGLSKLQRKQLAALEVSSGHLRLSKLQRQQLLAFEISILLKRFTHDWPPLCFLAFLESPVT